MEYKLGAWLTFRLCSISRFAKRIMLLFIICLVKNMPKLSFKRFQEFKEYRIRCAFCKNILDRNKFRGEKEIYVGLDKLGNEIFGYKCKACTTKYPGVQKRIKKILA